MRTEVLCPSRAPLRPVKKPGDGLVRYWLALQGRLVIKSSPHDFGSYLAVEAVFDEAGQEYALRCENQQPRNWDDQARAELGLEASNG